MSQPLSESDIIFPHLSNTPNFSTTLSSLRRSTLSIHNRLNSIVSDSQFVISVAQSYGLPLVANERCGSWYIPTEKKVEGVYFKSTDGHMSQWSFSLRRLNLQLVDVVEKYGGAVIVDSTRRGKSMPDALSKTVPIWCCVINRAAFGNDGKHELFTPPQAVGDSEHSQMEKRIDGFLRQFLEICKPNLEQLREKLRKPLRPIWVTQKSSLPVSPPQFVNFHPVVLCTASRRIQGAEGSEGGYIQGAADDHEAWSHGLTPTIFWKHQKTLMSTNEEDTPDLVASLIEQEAKTNTKFEATLIKPTSSILISSSQDIDVNDFNIVVSCTPSALSEDVFKSAKATQYLHLKCQTGKLGSRDLRNELSQLPAFLQSIKKTACPRILICCPTGKDLAVGTALAILCMHVSDNGNLDLSHRRAAKAIDKNFIKQRLSWITTSNPALNPSRATLQSVNAMLLTSQDPKTLHQALPIRPKTPLPEHPPSPNPDPARTISSRIFANLATSDSSTWTFHRTLTSTLPTHPSGTVTGTATFTPCNLPSSFPPTLLYAEQGDFVTTTGLKFSARRRYVYQLIDDAAHDASDASAGASAPTNKSQHIVVKFFDDDEALPRAAAAAGVGARGEGIGGVFVEMDSVSSSVEGDAHIVDAGKPVLVAKNRETHVCAEDLYTASWEFGGDIVGSEGQRKGEMWWEVRYDVKGPKKDYVSVTRYEKVAT